MYSVQLDDAVFAPGSKYPKLAAVPQEYRNKVRLTIDTEDGQPANYEWYPVPTTVGKPVDYPIVRERRALYLGLQPVYLDDQIVEANWTTNSIVSRMLAHYVMRGLIIVKKNGVVVTAATLNGIATAA